MSKFVFGLGDRVFMKGHNKEGIIMSRMDDQVTENKYMIRHATDDGLESHRTWVTESNLTEPAPKNTHDECSEVVSQFSPKDPNFYDQDVISGHNKLQHAIDIIRNVLTPGRMDIDFENDKLTFKLSSLDPALRAAAHRFWKDQHFSKRESK